MFFKPIIELQDSFDSSVGTLNIEIWIGNISFSMLRFLFYVYSSIIYSFSWLLWGEVEIEMLFEYSYYVALFVSQIRVDLVKETLYLWVY